MKEALARFTRDTWRELTRFVRKRIEIRCVEPNPALANGLCIYELISLYDVILGLLKKKAKFEIIDALNLILL